MGIFQLLIAVNDSHTHTQTTFPINIVVEGAHALPICNRGDRVLRDASGTSLRNELRQIYYYYYLSNLRYINITLSVCLCALCSLRWDCWICFSFFCSVCGRVLAAACFIAHIAVSNDGNSHSCTRQQNEQHGLAGVSYRNGCTTLYYY